jgi:hypothetical protein
MRKQNHGLSTRFAEYSNTNPRTVYGFHPDRLCGLHDLLHSAQGLSVLDIAMNHGLVGFEFARGGAALVHGCDNHEPAVSTARDIFAELDIPSRFEVVDLTGGPAALQAAFGADYLPRYDVVLFLGIYHKLIEQTSEGIISELVRHLIGRTARYFVIRSAQVRKLDPVFSDCGLRRVHFSDLSPIAGPVEIWQHS